MVTKKTIRCYGRRTLIALLATAGCVGMPPESAIAQSGTPLRRAMNGGAAYGAAPRYGAVTTTSTDGIVLAPGETLVPDGAMGGKTMSGPAFEHDGMSYQVIDSSSVPTAVGNSTGGGEMPMLQSPNYGGYATNGYAGGNCATGNCGSSSSSAGRFGTGQGGKLGSGGNACGPTCNPYIYAGLDALYFTNRNVDNFTLSPDFFMNDFDYSFGVRGTVGMVPNCRNGMEVSFVSPMQWNTSALLNRAGGGIDTFLRPGGTLTRDSLSGFGQPGVPAVPPGLPIPAFLSVAQQQDFSAEYYSLEASRTLIGWEVMKFLYGARYVNYDEDLLYQSQNTLGNRGVLASSTQNRMIGGQVGLDMTYPLSCKLWSDFRGRAGAYANFAENQFGLSNASTVVARNFDDDVQLAGVFEIGGGARYYLTDDFHLRAGAELWYLAGVASAQSQFDSNIRQDTGRSLRSDDDVLMFGITLGGEWKF